MKFHFLFAKYYPFLFILFMLGCKTSKLDNSQNVVVSEFQVGKFSYFFAQDSSTESCSYHSLPEDKLIQFLELNHDGDRDDRVPRKLMSYDQTILSRKKSELYSSPLEVKLCMDREGQVVALRYVHESNIQNRQISEALKGVSFGSNQESACVECTGLYLWTIE